MRIPQTKKAWALTAAGVGAALAVIVVSRQRAPRPTGAPPAEVREPRCRTTRASPVVRAAEMTAICDDVYAEGGLDDARTEELKVDVELATRNLEAYFGALRSSPLVLFCHTASCKVAFGAPLGAASANDLGFASAQVMLDDGSIAPSAVVVTGPVEGTARILTHELVHAEMKAWVAYDALPTWFNEGTATFIASEPRCDAAGPASEEIDVTRLRTKASWQRHLARTGKTLETYCAARRKVEAWMLRFDSDALRGEALKSLMTSVGGGTPFEAAYDAL